ADEARLGARPRRSAALLLQRRHHRHQAAEVSALPTWWHWARWVIANRAWSHHHLLGYLRMLRARARVPGLVFEGPCFIGPDVQFQVAPGTARLVVGAYTHIGGGSALRAHEGTLRIGPKTVIGVRNTVNTWLDVEIGASCIFADDVYVCDFDHRTEDLDVPI